jgi:hypothetical protein
MGTVLGPAVVCVREDRSRDQVAHGKGGGHQATRAGTAGWIDSWQLARPATRSCLLARASRASLTHAACASRSPASPLCYHHCMHHCSCSARACRSSPLLSLPVLRPCAPVVGGRWGSSALIALQLRACAAAAAASASAAAAAASAARAEMSVCVCACTGWRSGRPARSWCTCSRRGRPSRPQRRACWRLRPERRSEN